MDILGIDKEYEQVKQARGSIEQTQLHLESVQTMHQNLATEAQEWRTNLSQLQAGTFIVEFLEIQLLWSYRAPEEVKTEARSLGEGRAGSQVL